MSLTLKNEYKIKKSFFNRMTCCRLLNELNSNHIPSRVPYMLMGSPSSQFLKGLVSAGHRMWYGNHWSGLMAVASYRCEAFASIRHAPLLSGNPAVASDYFHPRADPERIKAT